MVRVTAILARVPVIKFRKGSLGRQSGSPTPAAGSTANIAPSSASAPQTQSAATMSTRVISDIELPARYRRQPLSQEEIDHINGGGIV